MIRDRKTVTTVRENIPMSNKQAAVLIAKMHADIVSRLRYENKLEDPDYAEATALAIAALNKGAN